MMKNKKVDYIPNRQRSDEDIVNDFFRNPQRRALTFTPIPLEVMQAMERLKKPMPNSEQARIRTSNDSENKPKE